MTLRLNSVIQSLWFNINFICNVTDNMPVDTMTINRCNSMTAFVVDIMQCCWYNVNPMTDTVFV